MGACWCSLAGTAACQHCRNNPMATDVWTNKPNVAVDHVEAKPFGNGLDVCPVCGKPTTIGKPQTNADRIRCMTDEELVNFVVHHDCCPGVVTYTFSDENRKKYGFDGRSERCECGECCYECWLDWLKKEKKEDE